MNLPSTFIVVVVCASVVTAQSGAPRIENGRVVMRSTDTIDLAARGASTSDEPAWVAWRVAMIDGQGSLCSTWSNDGDVVRGEVLDPQMGSDGRPRLSAPTGPAQLEAGTQLVMLVRVINGRVERVRSISDDCPIDANGRTVEWLSAAAMADSVAFLAALAQPQTLTTDTRRVAQSAMTALAWHRDPSVTARLVGWLGGTDQALRLTAARALAAYRGPAGSAAVIAAATVEDDINVRQQLVQAVGRSHDPGAIAALLRIARSDSAASVRGEAITAYARLAGAAQISQILEIATTDASPDVQRRALAAIGRMPQNAGVPALLTLARSTAGPALKKEAVRALSVSDDPRAKAYLEQILKD